MNLTGVADRLRLELADYTVAGVNTALGRTGVAAIEREQRVPGILHASRQPGRLPLLVKLFLLGHALTAEEYEVALPSIPQEEAIDTGLVTKDIKARIALRPIAVPERHGGGELIIASDLGPLQGCSPEHDHVMPVGGATKTLAAITSYEPGQSVLDLGTGCGYHALLAARAGARVVATDVSERALDFARLNAALAGLTIETRLGSLYEPVPERFDRIVTNPPFVVTPPSVRAIIGTYDYRDAGVDGDSLLTSILTGVEDHLTDDGVAWMLGNWLVDAEVDSGEFGVAWQDPVREWIGDREAWVVLRDATDPAQYAEMWLRDAGITGSAFTMAYCSWLKEINADSVAFGYITVGALPGPQRLEDYRGPIGDSFADAAWQNRRLAALSDDALMSKHLRTNGVVEKRLHTPGQADPWFIALSGHGREIPVSAEAAGFVGACDGELSVAQIIGALAGLLDASTDDMVHAVLPTVRELIGAGLLVDIG